MDLNEIYTELIREHSRNKENRRPLSAEGIIEKRGHNPSCGDDISVSLELEGDVLKDIAFMGDGCAISLASTSIMIDLLKGKTREEAQKTINIFTKMIKREETDENILIDELEDAYAFKNISNMPSRVKCATLGWHTLDEILEGSK